MEFIYSRDFKKQFAKLSPSLKRAVQERIFMFTGDEFHPLLNNHKLTGEWRGYRSINVTGDYRLIFKKETEHLTRLEAVGTHPQLYG